MKKNLFWIGLPVFVIMALTGLHHALVPGGLLFGLFLLIVGSAGLWVCMERVELLSGRVVAPEGIATKPRRVRVVWTEYQFAEAEVEAQSQYREDIFAA